MATPVMKDLQDLLSLPPSQAKGTRGEISVPSSDQEVIVPEPRNPIAVINIPEHEPTAENDLAFARENLLVMMSQGSELFRDAVEFSRSAESSRSIEVTVQLMKALADMNKDLVDLHLKKKQLERGRAVPPGNGQGGGQPPEGADGQIFVDKAIFVGSTSDLQKALRNWKDGGSQT